MSNKSPTVFTDDSLLFMEASFNSGTAFVLDPAGGKALLARLEAAERVCKEMKNSYIPDAFTASLMSAREAVPAWLKAAGKR